VNLSLDLFKIATAVVYYSGSATSHNKYSLLSDIDERKTLFLLFFLAKRECTLNK
jgi:hypothetical protein